jgi:glyoxylase-like metal-dependent hydrolase (beta-lactamase superfamily II)
MTTASPRPRIPHLPATLSRRDALRLLGLSGLALAAMPAWLRAASGPAPELTGTEPGFYRFRIGGLEAVALSDGGISGPLSTMNFWADVQNKVIVDALYAAFEPPEIHLGFSVLLVKVGNELVLVDTGCGSLFGPIGGRLVGNLAAIGVTPEQITTVILSHAHGDHMGGLLNLQTGQVTFKNARHLIHGSEYDFWMGGNPDLSAVRMPDDAKATAKANARKVLDGLKDRWERVNPGDKPMAGLEIIDAPGHTPGHIGVLYTDGGESLLHVADAAHHHTLSFEHPEWGFIADVQPEVAKQTRRRLLARAAEERIRIFGAHLPFPAIGHVRATEGHFEYVIEPWNSA